MYVCIYVCMYVPVPWHIWIVSAQFYTGCPNLTCEISLAPLLCSCWWWTFTMYRQFVGCLCSAYPSYFSTDRGYLSDVSVVSVLLLLLGPVYSVFVMSNFSVLLSLLGPVYSVFVMSNFCSLVPVGPSLCCSLALWSFSYFALLLGLSLRS